MMGSRKCHSPVRATLAILLIVPLLSGCGLIFVEGPPLGWQGAPDPEEFALTQPCTQSKALVVIDGAIGSASALLGGSVLVLLIGGKVYHAEKEAATAFSISSLLVGGAWGFSAYQGNKRVNDCRAFNARVLELRRGGASSLTSHEWLDELFPLRDLGVTAFDPVFGLPIKQGH